MASLQALMPLSFSHRDMERVSDWVPSEKLEDDRSLTADVLRTIFVRRFVGEFNKERDDLFGGLLKERELLPGLESEWKLASSSSSFDC